MRRPPVGHVCMYDIQLMWLLCCLVALQEDELDEAEVSGFDAEALSLWCGNTASDHLVQVRASTGTLLS